MAHCLILMGLALYGGSSALFGCRLGVAQVRARCSMGAGCAAWLWARFRWLRARSFLSATLAVYGCRLGAVWLLASWCLPARGDAKRRVRFCLGTAPAMYGFGYGFVCLQNFWMLLLLLLLLLFLL